MNIIRTQVAKDYKRIRFFIRKKKRRFFHRISFSLNVIFSFLMQIKLKFVLVTIGYPAINQTESNTDAVQKKT